MSDKILAKEKIEQIMKRISYQIFENNMEEELILVGVDNGGRQFAEVISGYLMEIARREAKCFTLSIDKENPLVDKIEMDAPIEELANKAVILCDDVLNSGKTLAYSLSKILSVGVKKVETAVLVMRSHSQFPIYANYKGYELSTTINEHVQVKLDEGVFLT